MAILSYTTFAILKRITENIQRQDTSTTGKATMVTIPWKMEFLFCHTVKLSLVKQQNRNKTSSIQREKQSSMKGLQAAIGKYQLCHSCTEHKNTTEKSATVGKVNSKVNFVVPKLRNRILFSFLKNSSSIP